MHVPASRLAGTALATAALALGGLAVGAGTAQAATTVQCASALSVDEGFYGFLAEGCNAFTPAGGPYTVTVAAFDDTWINFNGGVTSYPYTDVNLTCQAFTVSTIGTQAYSASDCVANSYG